MKKDFEMFLALIDGMIGRPIRLLLEEDPIENGKRLVNDLKLALNHRPFSSINYIPSHGVMTVDSVVVPMNPSTFMDFFLGMEDLDIDAASWDKYSISINMPGIVPELKIGKKTVSIVRSHICPFKEVEVIDGAQLVIATANDELTDVVYFTRTFGEQGKLIKTYHVNQ